MAPRRRIRVPRRPLSIPAGLFDVLDGAVARLRGTASRSVMFTIMVLDRRFGHASSGQVLDAFRPGSRVEQALALATLGIPTHGEPYPGGGRGRRRSLGGPVPGLERYLAMMIGLDVPRHAPPDARGADGARRPDCRAARVKRARNVPAEGDGRRVRTDRPLAELPDGEMRAYDLTTDGVALAHVENELFAFGDECTHEGCSLAEGELGEQEETVAPSRQWLDLRTGGAGRRSG